MPLKATLVGCGIINNDTSTREDPMILLGSNYIHSFCKLDHFKKVDFLPHSSNLTQNNGQAYSYIAPVLFFCNGDNIKKNTQMFQL
jgi:hypothetical protein